MRIAHVCGVIARSSASASPYGIETKPGTNGPKSLRYCSVVLALMADIVRPWKLFLNTMISAAFGAMPLIEYPQRRASLIAVSTASTPVLVGKAMSKSHSRVSFSRKPGSRSLRIARDVNVTLRACASSAARMRGWPCPWLTAEYALTQSR